MSRLQTDDVIWIDLILSRFYAIRVPIGSDAINKRKVSSKQKQPEVKPKGCAVFLEPKHREAARHIMSRI